MNMPEVTAAVVTLSRRDGAASLPQDTLSHFESADFRSACREYAADHQVLGLVLVELERGAAGRLSPAVTEENRQQLKGLRRQAALWDFERDQVVARIQDRSIPVVVLKGAALRLTAYSDSAQRPFGDIDILVPRESLWDVVGLLESHGYTRHSEHRDKVYLEHFHHLVLARAPGFKVEVHWALAPATSTLTLDAEAFLRDAVALPSKTGVPAPEHMVIHLSAQNLEDGFSKLMRLVDLDRVIAAAGAGFDWDRLGAEALRMEARGAVALSLQLCRRLLGTEVPTGFIAGLDLSASVRAHLARLDPVRVVLERRGKRGDLRTLLALWCTDRSAARREMVRDMITGKLERAWRELLQQQRGPLRRLAAVLHVGATHFSRYPAVLGGRLGANDFWRDP